eukprot:SAG31_NODE_3683_length_3989_cov_3.622108_5_plen_268_part_00
MSSRSTLPPAALCARSPLFLMFLMFALGVRRSCRAMPYMLDQAGVLAGVIMFVVSMAMTQFSIVRLCEVEDDLVGGSAPGSVNSGSAKAGLAGGLLQTASLQNGHPVLVAERQRTRKESWPPPGTMEYTTLSKITGVREMDAPTTALHDDLDYSAIVKALLGSSGEWMALMSIVISSWGSCIAYILYIKDNMHALFGLEEYQWVLISLAPLACLAVLDDVRFLAPTSIAGLACAFGFGCIVVGTAVGTLDSGDLHAFVRCACAQQCS